MHKIIYMIGMAIIFAYIYNRRLNASENRFSAKKEAYINEEIMSNETSYIKDIPKEFYVTPSKEEFPFKEYAAEDKNKRVIKKQQQALKKFGLEMITFPNRLTNTDIKKEYGRDNLEKIMILEEHYNGFMRSLLNWAEELIRINENSDAILILERCVHYNGDITKIYIHLAALYEQKGDKESLIILKEKFLNSRCLLKENAKKYIDDCINRV